MVAANGGFLFYQRTAKDRAEIIPISEPDASGGRPGLVELWGAPEGSLWHRFATCA